MQLVKVSERILQLSQDIFLFGKHSGNRKCQAVQDFSIITANWAALLKVLWVYSLNCRPFLIHERSDIPATPIGWYLACVAPPGMEERNLEESFLLSHHAVFQMHGKISSVCYTVFLHNFYRALWHLTRAGWLLLKFIKIQIQVKPMSPFARFIKLVRSVYPRNAEMTCICSLVWTMSWEVADTLSVSQHTIFLGIFKDKLFKYHIISVHVCFLVSCFICVFFLLFFLAI